MKIEYIIVIILLLIISIQFAEKYIPIDFFEEKQIKAQGVMIINGKAVPLTQLTQEQLEIQQKDGCSGCHIK